MLSLEFQHYYCWWLWYNCWRGDDGDIKMMMMWIWWWKRFTQHFISFSPFSSSTFLSLFFPHSSPSSILLLLSSFPFSLLARSPPPSSSFTWYNLLISILPIFLHVRVLFTSSSRLCLTSYGKKERPFSPPSAPNHNRLFSYANLVTANYGDPWGYSCAWRLSTWPSKPSDQPWCILLLLYRATRTSKPL